MRKLPKRYSKHTKVLVQGTSADPGYRSVYGASPLPSRASGSPPATLRQLKWSLILGALFWAWWLTAGKDVGLDVFVRRQVQDAFGPTSGKRLDE